MATRNDCQPVKLLREWAPLTDLFNKLPATVKNGIFTQDVKLTCLDALPEFIAIGTNVGIVFWYDRLKKELQQFKCEKQSIQLSVVKIISTVDYMVAAGCKNGIINIFQVPKSHPSSIPENLKPKGKQVERYTVSELHKTEVTAIEWAKNGMKLFSGDANGCIVFTEIDFYMHICKSYEILNESYPVVQLSYQTQRLLVSTTYRTIISEKQEKWKVLQVGKKDRKVLGSFGGIIYKKVPKISESVLYCTRPGLRIWISDYQGNVNQTLLFKDLLKKECFEVPVINPISKVMKQLKPVKEPSFGVLLNFDEGLLVTFSNDVVYILDPEKLVVISTISLLRSVLWVTTCKDEIFILEEDRSIIRIAYQPEQNATFSSPTTTFMPSLKDLSTILQNSTIIPAISPFDPPTPSFDIHTDSTAIVGAEEAKESPIRVKNRNELEKFAEIGRQEFNDAILYKSNKAKRKQSRMCSSMSSLSSNSSEEKDASGGIIKPTMMSLSSIGVLPDLRSPQSIQSDIEYKEKILADILCLDKKRFTMRDKKVEKVVEEDILSDDGKISNLGLEKDQIGRVDELEPSDRDNGFITDRLNVTSTIKPPGIPNEWKLSDIKIHKPIPIPIPKLKQTESPSIDNSLTDWEIV